MTSSQCFIRNKHQQSEIAFSFYKIPDSCIVLACHNKSEEGKKMERFCNLSVIMLKIRLNPQFM